MSHLSVTIILSFQHNNDVMFNKTKVAQILAKLTNPCQVILFFPHNNFCVHVHAREQKKIFIQLYLVNSRD